MTTRAPTEQHHPTATRRYRPIIACLDSHLRGRDVAELATRVAGEWTHPTAEEALTAGREAVARTLSELGLFGWRVTPPRIRVTAVPVVVTLPNPAANPRTYHPGGGW